MSPIQSAKLDGHDTYRYLKDSLVKTPLNVRPPESGCP